MLCSRFDLFQTGDHGYTVLPSHDAGAQLGTGSVSEPISDTKRILAKSN